MSKKKKQSEAKQVALEAIDLVITARKADLETKRREQVRKNRGEEATWEEAKRSTKFADKVKREIELMGVAEGDLTVGEWVKVQKLIIDRANDHAFKWASRKATRRAAESHDAELYDSWVVGIVRGTRTLVGKHLSWEERHAFIKQGFHGCADESCIEQTVTNIKAVVEERKRKADMTEVLASKAATAKAEYELYDEWDRGIRAEVKQFIDKWIAEPELQGFIKRDFHGCTDVECMRQTINKVTLVVNDRQCINWIEEVLGSCEYLLGEYMTGDEFMERAKAEWHEGADDDCARVFEAGIGQLVEERKRAHAEALVNEATRGTMTLDEFAGYVNTGQLKKDVDEALKPFEGVIAYMRDGVLEVLEGLADIAYGSDGEDEDEATSPSYDYRPINEPITFSNTGNGQVKVEDDNTITVTVTPVMKVVDGGITVEVHHAPDLDHVSVAELVRRAGFRKA